MTGVKAGKFHDSTMRVMRYWKTVGCFLIFFIPVWRLRLVMFE